MSDSGIVASASFFHVTTPAIAPIILRDGFKDNASRRGLLGVVTHQFEPGVWFSEAPPITAISVDQFLGHEDEAWIVIRVSREQFDAHFVGNEWQEESWPLRQWLVPAAVVNQFPRAEVPLVDVLRMRLTDTSTKHHRYYTPDVMRRQIHTEMRGEIQAKWLAALKQACRAPRLMTGTLHRR